MTQIQENILVVRRAKYFRVAAREHTLPEGTAATFKRIESYELPKYTSD